MSKRTNKSPASRAGMKGRAQPRPNSWQAEVNMRTSGGDEPSTSLRLLQAASCFTAPWPPGTCVGPAMGEHMHTCTSRLAPGGHRPGKLLGQSHSSRGHLEGKALVQNTEYPKEPPGDSRTSASRYSSCLSFQNFASLEKKAELGI